MNLCMREYIGFILCFITRDVWDEFYENDFTIKAILRF